MFSLLFHYFEIFTDIRANYWREITALFFASTIIYLTSKYLYYRIFYNTTRKYTQTSIASTTVLNNFHINSTYLCNDNSVYLTKFKYDDYKAILFHILYGYILYFSDAINIYCLLVGIGQVYDFNDYRTFYPLTFLATVAMLGHVLGVSSILKNQRLINTKLTTRLRNGKIKEVKYKSLKRGDFVILKDNFLDIPADLLLINHSSINIVPKIAVQELDLTGEDIVISKTGITLPSIHNANITINHHEDTGHVACSLEHSNIYYDSKHILYRGTQICDFNNEQIIGLVIETGNDCKIYRIDNNIQKSVTDIQKELNDICLKNLYLMLLLASLFGVILYSKTDDDGYKHLWTRIRIMILLLNSMVPLSLQVFYNMASRVLSNRISEHHNVKINRHGITSFQTNPKFIVSDKTGTITTGQLDLATVITNNEQTNTNILMNVLSCSEIALHSKTKQLLKNDLLEERLLDTYLKLTDTQLHSNSNMGSVFVNDGNLLNIEKLFYSPFDYKYEVKIGVTKSTYTDNHMYLHVQGTPESIDKYSNGKISALLKERKTSNIPEGAYERVIAHGSKIITSEDLEILRKSPISILNDLTNVSLYVFYDYVVPNISTTISELLSSGKDFTLLTGDKMSSAITIGNIIKITDKYKVFSTVEDIDNYTLPTNSSIYCNIINGRLLETLVSSTKKDKLTEIISSSDKKIIFRASPNSKQIYVSYLQNTFNKEVMMIGDGSNDIASIIQSNIGVAINKPDNTNVQQVADIVVDTWRQIPSLFTDFKDKQILLQNISNTILSKHMTLSFMLIVMLFLSKFENFKDPASPYLMSLINSTVFVCSYMYCMWENSIIVAKRNILNSIITGILNGLLIFPHISINKGIKILICMQVLQIMRQLYRITSRKRTIFVYVLSSCIWVAYTYTTVQPNIIYFVIVITLSQTYC